MKVRHHEVSVGGDVIKRHQAQRYPGNSTDDEVEDKANQPVHRGFKHDLATPHGPDVIEKLDPGGNRYQHGPDSESYLPTIRQ